MCGESQSGEFCEIEVEEKGQGAKVRLVHILVYYSSFVISILTAYPVPGLRLSGPHNEHQRKAQRADLRKINNLVVIY